MKRYTFAPNNVGCCSSLTAITFYGTSSARPETEPTCSPAFAIWRGSLAEDRDMRNPSSRGTDGKVSGSVLSHHFSLSLGVLLKVSAPGATRIPKRIPTTKASSSEVGRLADFLSGEGEFASLFSTSRVQPFPLHSNRNLNSIGKMKRERKAAYIVWVGRKPGIYHTWKECEEQVLEYPKARYKGFTSLNEAEMTWNLGFDEYEKGRKFLKEGGPVREKTVARKVPAVIAERARRRVNGALGSSTFTCAKERCVFPECFCGLN